MSIAALEVYARPDKRLPYIGVTGTNGKTSITYMLESIFRFAGLQPARMGTIAYKFGSRETRATMTTPEAPDLARFAATVAEENGSHLIMEVSAHAISLFRVFDVAFDTAIFTNFSQDHLDFYSNLDDYFDAKKRLFDGRNGLAPRLSVINTDDTWGKTLYGECKGEKYSTGTSPGTDVQIEAFDFTSSGLTASLKWHGNIHHIKTPLLGHGNLHNVTQSFACAVLHGIDPAAIGEALSQIAPIPGRMEEVLPGHPFRVIVDYAHTEDALTNACEILRQVAPGQLIVVFGCGGDRDRAKRPQMGRTVAQHADVVMVTSDNPRSEDPEAIIDDIIPGILEVRTDYHRISDRREAIEQAISLARRGDTILLAGKGHETGQIVGDHVLPFVDKDVALGFLHDMARRDS